MSRPFHILKHEHRIIERVLRALDGVCMRLEGREKVPAAVLQEIVRFITTFADRYHHGKEETFLFPALERRGIAREGPLAVMEYEHQVERELISDLVQAIDMYKEGSIDAAQDFIVASRTYLQLLVGHIEKEDNILFRIGDEVLDDAEKRALAESFKETDAALGDLSLEDYELLATSLEEKWAV
jgi:hemerythrin-like domain-containing protein